MTSKNMRCWQKTFNCCPKTLLTRECRKGLKCPFRWTIVNRGQSIANSDEQTWCGYRVKAWPAAALPWRISHQKLIYRLPSTSHLLSSALPPYGFLLFRMRCIIGKAFHRFTLGSCCLSLFVTARKLLGNTFWISYSSTFITS